MISQSKKSNLNKIALTSLMLFLLFNFSFAQDTAKTSNEASPLKELKGFTQTFYYIPGYEARAETIALLMEQACIFLKKR
ncbi:MAG: hypothetical protein WKF35_04950 [Ferruginibacter sp.]